MATVKLFKGDTFIAPAIKIAASNFSSLYLTGTLVRFNIRAIDTLNSVVLALDQHITISIGQESITYPPNPKTPDVVITELLWFIRIEVVIPKELMNIPIGEYFFDYELTYPNGVRKTYYQTKLIIRQDASYV
jgi:hypothetical protein